jgi:hypothetical protein
MPQANSCGISFKKLTSRNYPPNALTLNDQPSFKSKRYRRASCAKVADPMSSTSRLLALAKAVIPAPLRTRLVALRQERLFSHALRAFHANPAVVLLPHSPVLADLVSGWGNPWSAKEEYLVACIEAALSCEGDILECGSGLSTLLLAMVAQVRGISLRSLEHNGMWALKINLILRRYKVGPVAELCQLKDYGDYTWYDANSRVGPDQTYSLVVCDGPPGSTKGGRYGLLPVMRNQLSPGAVILLDDGARLEEQKIAASWATELQGTWRVEGVHKPFIRICAP